MMSSFDNKLNKVAVQTLLLACLLGYSMLARAQGKPLSTVIKRDNEHTVSVLYRLDDKMHCTAPIRYVIRKTGTTHRNQVVKWAIRYVPCNSQTITTETISFSIPKGSGTKEMSKEIRTRNLVSIFDESSLVTKYIEEPDFYITGPASIMEGDYADVSIQTVSAAKGVKWVWSGGAFKDTIGSGTNISRKFMATTRIYAYPVLEGFVGSPRSFTVNVVKRPDAPADFTITGPGEITDIQTATLLIEPNTKLLGVKWIWEQGNKKIGEGLSIMVDPKESATYTVHSEYFWKRSPAKTYQLKVQVLPPAPDEFEIAGPARINEGERVWLRIVNGGNNRAVRWKWLNQRTREELVADSVLVFPDETTTFSVVANLNGKLSSRKTKTIEVIEKAAAPQVVGEFSKCIASTKPLTFTLKGGKLGTGSRYWNWYEGECGAGKLIHRGSELNISPSRTTTYYVQPENNRTVCQQFTIRVGEMPVLPERLAAVKSACNNEVITVEAVGSRNAGTNWNWFVKRSNSYFKSYKGSGASIQDTITGTTLYTVVASNNFCTSTVERTGKVELAESSSPSSYINVLPKKGRHYVLSQIGGSLAPGAQWVWYKGDCKGSPIGYGEQIDYKAHKTNKVLVRAEGTCGSTACTSAEFVGPTKRRFIYVNFGLASNDIPKDIMNSNAQFTIGSNSIYFRGRAPLSLFKSDDKKPLGDTKLETDNTHITNYPTNTNTYYVINGEKKNEVYSVSGGFLLGGRVLKIYLGGGYGKRTLYWGADIKSYNFNTKQGTTWARHLNETVSGAMVEGGAFLRLGAFNISAGMNMIKEAKVFLSFDAGVGFTFKRK